MRQGNDALNVQRRWLQHRRQSTISPTLTVGVAASFTAEPLEAYLGAALLDFGEAPAFSFADYNQIHQVSFDAGGMLGNVDVAVVLWRIEDVLMNDLRRWLDGDVEAAGRIIGGAADLGRAIAAWSDSACYPVLVGVPPSPAPLGVDLCDSAVSVGLSSIHARATAAFMEQLAGRAARLVDHASWVRSVGDVAAHDWLKWAAYRQPYTLGMWAEMGKHLGDVIAREKVPPPKCIVLDADNTLWGGVIGEDGIGGIELSAAFPGSAFQEFQRVLANLRARGVLLAVASKNNHADVVQVFEQHDDMVLSTDDIAVWRVNWGPKSQSIREIAADLNIGEDALIFIDDSSYELAEVNAALPHVRCLQVPEDVAELPNLVASSGYFRNMRVSAEDLARTEMILAEQSRKGQASVLTREEFLASLELAVEYFAVTDDHVGRVAQLTNKTNQFNLTTIRRTEADVRSLLLSPRHLLRAIRVRDKFGEYGLVGVAVLEQQDDEWSVETLLMSCRVLGRGVETAFLARLVDDIRSVGGSSVRARFVPTAKNGIVADLYARHGFHDDDEGWFVAAIDDVSPAPSHIRVV